MNPNIVHDRTNTDSPARPNRLRKYTTAALGALAFVAGGQELATNAKASSSQSGPKAVSAVAKPNCHRPSAAICNWEFRRADPLAGDDRHPWINCVRIGKSRLKQDVTCQVSRAESDTVTADVGGVVELPFGTLSTKVGYNVTQTTTVTTSDSVEVPSHTSGIIQWAGVFADRYTVTQEYQKCFEDAPGYYDNCFPAVHPTGNNIRFAYTEKYDSPEYRVISN